MKVEKKGEYNMDKKKSITVSDINIESLCQNSIELIQYARQIAAKQVNLVQLMTYYSIGRWIVEEQQQGVTITQDVLEQIDKIQ